MLVSACFYPTNPAPFDITSTTMHVVTTSPFFCSNSATWALNCEILCDPQPESYRSFILAFTSVPNTCAFEAHLLAAFTNSSIPATAGLADYPTAVRPRAPFKVLVPANTHVFSDEIELFGHFFGTKPLDISGAELLFAFELHARQMHNHACLNASL